MTDTVLKPVEALLRGALLAHSDILAAVAVCNEISDYNHLQFNAESLSREMNVSTSLFARAMLMRSTLQTAATWLAQEAKVPLPQAHAVVLSLVLDPPPMIETTVTKETSS